MFDKPLGWVKTDSEAVQLGLILKLLLHNDSALSPMELVANFLITQHGVKFLCCDRRRHPYSSEASVGSSCMNDIHQVPTDTTTLVRRINENSPDYITVEACSADNIFAPQGYENLALGELSADGFWSKAALDLSDDIRRVVPRI